MNPIHLIAAAVAAASIAAAASAAVAATSLTERYSEGRDMNFQSDWRIELITTEKEKTPAEINSLISEASRTETAPETRDELLRTAERMAKTYRIVTNDIKPLKDVQRSIMELKLPEPLRPADEDGVCTVAIPVGEGGDMPTFSPANIIIKSGQTVRWVNNGKTALSFASIPGTGASRVPIIGLGGISAPPLDPGAKWEHTFDKPGEYYYISYTQNGMVGKVTVEE